MNHGESMPGDKQDTSPHMKNFLDAVRSRDYKSLTAEIEIGAHSANFCHLATCAYRVGRMLKLDAKGQAPGDNEAKRFVYAELTGSLHRTRQGLTC